VIQPRMYGLYTAVMRKMIVLINTLLRQDRLWQPIAP